MARLSDSRCLSWFLPLRPCGSLCFGFPDATLEATMLPVVARTEADREVRRHPFARRTSIRSGGRSSSDSSPHT